MSNVLENSVKFKTLEFQKHNSVFKLWFKRPFYLKEAPTVGDYLQVNNKCPSEDNQVKCQGENVQVKTNNRTIANINEINSNDETDNAKTLENSISQFLLHLKHAPQFHEFIERQEQFAVYLQNKRLELIKRSTGAKAVTLKKSMVLSSFSERQQKYKQQLRMNMIMTSKQSLKNWVIF